MSQVEVENTWSERLFHLFVIVMEIFTLFLVRNNFSRTFFFTVADYFAS